MEKIVDNITYVSVPEGSEQNCDGCIADRNIGLCKKLSGKCISQGIIWQTKRATDFYDEQTKQKTWPETFARAMNKENLDEKMAQPCPNGLTKKNDTTLPIDTNPKTAVAMKKPRLSDVPPVSLFALGAAMSDGAKKYGRFNFRDTGATASVFYDAIMRHLTDWYNGEDYADDSKVHHLGHIMASCAILLDAELHKALNDDRQKHGSISRKPEGWISK